MSLNKDIEALIEKYYNGETSLEEEAQLQDFFFGEDIPDHLLAHKKFFVNQKELKEASSVTFSDTDLFAKLDKQLESEKAETKVVSMNTSSSQVWFYRIAAAVALVLVGYFAGNLGGPSDEVKIMREELAQMKSLMMTQITGSSASGRLQAVNFSFELDEVDDQLLDALIERLFEDKNTNVRLKAVEALAHFGSDPRAKQALVTALGEESDPGVQISLINTLVALKEKSALENLQKIVDGENNLKDVKDEAHMGMFKLKEL